MCAIIPINFVMNYSQVLNGLETLSVRGMDFGLERTRALLDGLGAPDKKLKIIHIAGSNGKGFCFARIKPSALLLRPPCSIILNSSALTDKISKKACLRKPSVKL